jgi:Flp pilus assembly CpaF family ATPase
LNAWRRLDSRPLVSYDLVQMHKYANMQTAGPRERAFTGAPAGAGDSGEAMARPAPAPDSPSGPVAGAIERLLGAGVTALRRDSAAQEISANYAASSGRCRVFADFGAGAMADTEIELDAGAVEAAVRLIAAQTGKAIDPEAPFLNCVLDDGGRFSAVLEPAADGPGFSIRTHRRPLRPLGDFMAEWQGGALYRLSIERRLNTVIVGATSSGKTTLANAAIAMVPAGERLAIIEDEPELRVREGNVIRRRARGRADMRRHVREILRMRPDRIVIGEVRGGEALDLLKAWNTGHSGGFTTVHANSPRAALSRLESLIEEAGTPARPRLIAEAVNLLIFVERLPDGSRRVSEMALVEGYSAASGYATRRLTEDDA